MNNSKSYSVSQLSKMAGVSVRTLHYYDQIGLLVPERRKDNGYREYHQRHLVLLQQILIYREIDIGIEAIRKLLNAEDFDLVTALEEQKRTLLKRQKDTVSMIESIEATMSTLNEKRNREILFEGIPTEKVEHWRTLAREQSTDKGFEKYLKWIGGLSEEEARNYNIEGNAFGSDYQQVLHLPVGSIEVQELARRHYVMMNHSFYQLIDDFQGVSYKGFLAMAEKMLNDKLVNEVYEEYQEGMAKHLSEAMVYFAETELKDNEAELKKLGVD